MRDEKISEDFLREFGGTPSKKKLSPKRRSNESRIQIWIEVALELTGLSGEEFWRTYVDKADHPRKAPKTRRSKENSEEKEYSRTVDHWQKGEGGSRRTILSVAKQLESVIPDAGILFELPIFELLDERLITKKRIEKLVAPYLVDGDRGKIWKFPTIEYDNPIHSVFLNEIQDTNTHGLFLRGDFYGLMGILANVRWYEAHGDAQHHVGAMADLYRILPIIARTKWFSNPNHFQKLMNLVRYCHHSGYMATDLIIACDKSKLWFAMHDRRYSLVDEKTHDPVVYAEFPDDIDYVQSRIYV